MAITKPIDLFVIADQIGYYAYNPHPVSGLTARYIDGGTLCSHAGINKWSRRKPYSYPSNNSIYGLSGTDDTIIKDEINFGVSVTPIHAGMIPDTAVNESAYGIWGAWTPPTGGALSPYRPDDFFGYNNQAVKAINRVEFYNHNGGNRVVVKGAYTRDMPYTCKLYFNSNPDILLSEFKESVSGSISNMYLTLVIGSNMAGLSYPEAVLAQSTETVGEVLARGGTYMSAVINTQNLVSDGVLIGDPDIVFAYLAPKQTVLNQFPQGVSLKMDNTITSALYHETHAVYGDGSSDGGTLPTYTVVGDITFALDHPTYPNGDISASLSGSEVMVHLTGILLDITTGIAFGNGSLELLLGSTVYALDSSNFTPTAGEKYFNEFYISLPKTAVDANGGFYVRAKLTGSYPITNNISDMWVSVFY